MEDMKEYMHNGQKVIHQTISDDSFLDHLSKAGIVPEELPLLDNRVFKYTKDGVTRYACVYAANVPEMYLEKIYITESLPEEDGTFSRKRKISIFINTMNFSNLVDGVF